MSVFQITFVYGEKAEKIAAVLFDRTIQDPFAELQLVAAKSLDFGADVEPARVFFQYEDDDGDYVTLADNADALEAFAVHEDAGRDDLFLVVKLQPAGAKAKAEADLENKEDDVHSGLNTLLDENFVLELAAFLCDPMVRQVLPEVSANIAAAVLKRASARDLYDIATANAVLKQKPFLTQEWPFVKSWMTAYDQWISFMTEDQLGKVAFQIPLVVGRLAAKRNSLHKSIFVKHKPLGRILKITQFDFGSVDFASVLEKSLNNSAAEVSHAAPVACAVCKNQIDGARYQCMVCPGFDMCEACESQGSHPTEHAVMKFRSSVSGYVGLAHASSLYGTKAFKSQMKAMKYEARLAKKEAKLARKFSKDGDHHKKHHNKHHHGKHGKHGAMPPVYAACLSYAAEAAAAAGAPMKDNKPLKGNYGPVSGTLE